MTTRLWTSASWTMRPVASRPSILGIWTSISTTSGRSCRVTATAWSPSLASPTTSMSSSASRIIRKPARTSAWSSTSTTVIGHCTAPFSGKVACTANPPRGGGRHGGGPRAGSPAPHADQPVAAAVARRPVGPSGAVVQHLDLERRRPVAHPHRRGGPPECFTGVGERLLDDPVRRHLERGRERPRVTLDRQVDRQRPAGRLRHQIVELGQPRLGREFVGLAGAAQEPEQAVHLDDGLAAGGLDRAQGLGRLVGLAVHHPPGRPRLHPHETHVVGHDVVQLPGDADPLGEHGLAGVLLPLLLQLGGPVGQLALVSRNERMTDAQHPWQGEDDDVVGEDEALQPAA